MSEEKQFEQIPPKRRGEKVLRRRRRPRMRLRVVPNLPGLVIFLLNMARRTVLLRVVTAFIVLWLLFSMGIYFAEAGSGSEINSYGRALFVGVAAFSTAGISYVPHTTTGQLLTSIWMALGSALFVGTIVATVTGYFLLPMQRPTRQITSTVQYNLGKLEELSLEEVTTLRDAAIGLIDARIEQLRETPQQSQE